MDYYDVLDVSETASADEIRRAYREQSKRRHPDVNDDLFTERRFKHLQKAKEVLSNPKEKARYDRLGHEEYVAKRGGYARAELEPFYPDAGDESAGSADGVERNPEQTVVSEETASDEARAEDERKDGPGRPSAGSGKTSARTVPTEPSLRERYEKHVSIAGRLVLASVLLFGFGLLLPISLGPERFLDIVDGLPFFLTDVVNSATLLGYFLGLALTGVSIVYLVILSGVRAYLFVSSR